MYKYRSCNRKNTRWNDVDLCTITGNLLDNAIRAAKDIENASIEFVMRQHENKMVIKVKNPYRGVLKRREDVFETTKQNKTGMESDWNILKNCRTISWGNRF